MLSLAYACSALPVFSMPVVSCQWLHTCSLLANSVLPGHAVCLHVLSNVCAWRGLHGYPGPRMCMANTACLHMPVAGDLTACLHMLTPLPGTQYFYTCANTCAYCPIPVHVHHLVCILGSLSTQPACTYTSMPHCTPQSLHIQSLALAHSLLVHATNARAQPCPDLLSLHAHPCWCLSITACACSVQKLMSPEEVRVGSYGFRAVVMPLLVGLVA